MKKLFFCLFYVILMASCRKENTATPSGIRISATALNFDTLFTSTGSITKVLKIYNDNASSVFVDITLKDPNSTFFSFNADGVKGPVVDDLEVYGKDSVYVFVTVKIDPSADMLPFVITDSLSVVSRDADHKVNLTAWGQNARFLRSHVIPSDTTWTNELPVVIIGGLLVAENATLSIDEGTRIYLHADAPIIVDGSVKASGKYYDSTRIHFTGDRLDEYYKDLPASWPGIYFTEKSHDNLFEYVVIKNAYQGLVAESGAENATPKLTLRQVIIDNCYDAGIMGINTSIAATNCLISNCGKNLLLVMGGEYKFSHCTVAAIGNYLIPHKQPALAITDFIEKNDQPFFGALDASFINCIFWGSNGSTEDEVLLIREGTQPFKSAFVNCIWKNKNRPGLAETAALIENEDPMFVEQNGTNGNYNLRLKEGSPGINKGASTVVNTDLDGHPRTGVPDIGAYESTF